MGKKHSKNDISYMINLMYHDVYEASPHESGFQNESAFRYKIESTTFERHIKIVESAIKEGFWKKGEVVFTFDDGGVSAYTVVAPLLEKHGYKGVFFISTKYIGTPGFLNETQIKELKSRGHIVGSHSHTHPANITEKGVDLKQEWLESKAILESLVGEVDTCSIPNGYQSDDVLKSISSCGYKQVYTSRPSTAERMYKDLLVYGRYGIHDVTTDNDLKRILKSKAYRTKLSSRWFVLTLAKRILGNKYHNVKQNLLKK